MYNARGVEWVLLSGISTMVVNDKDWQKELDLFYLLYLLNDILVLESTWFIRWNTQKLY